MQSAGEYLRRAAEVKKRSAAVFWSREVRRIQRKCRGGAGYEYQRTYDYHKGERENLGSTRLPI